MKTITVEVTHEVEVTLDETQFTPEFLAHFASYMFDLDGVDGHAEHLAQMHVRGLAGWPDTFIEGYGPAEKMGIAFKVLDQRTEVVS